MLIVFLAIDTNRAPKGETSKEFLIFEWEKEKCSEFGMNKIVSTKDASQQCSSAHEDYAETKTSGGEEEAQLKTFSKMAVSVDNFYCSTVGR